MVPPFTVQQLPPLAHTPELKQFSMVQSSMPTMEDPSTTTPRASRPGASTLQFLPTCDLIKTLVMTMVRPYLIIADVLRQYTAAAVWSLGEKI